MTKLKTLDYEIIADELLAGTDTAKTESKTTQAQMLILELLANGKRMSRVQSWKRRSMSVGFPHAP